MGIKDGQGRTIRQGEKGKERKTSDGDDGMMTKGPMLGRSAGFPIKKRVRVGKRKSKTS